MPDPWRDALMSVRATVRGRIDAMRCDGTDEDYVRGKAQGRDDAADEILRVVDDAIAGALGKLP